MRSFPVLLATTFVLLACIPVHAQPRGRGGNVDASRYGWLSSLEEGRVQARASGKPMMVVIRCVP